MKCKNKLSKRVLNLTLVTGWIGIFILLGIRASNAQAQGGSDAGLVAYWKMEEGTGTTVVDSAGNGHDLTLTSPPATPQWSTDVPSLTGGNNASLVFDGADDYAYAFPLSETAGSSQLTVETWVKFDSPLPAGYRTVLEAVQTGLQQQWGLATIGNELHVVIYDTCCSGADQPTVETVGANLQPGQWYHVAFVYDGSGATDTNVCVSI